MSATQADALNPTLYRTMIRVFGEVRVTHAGEAFVAMAVTDLVTGRSRLDILQYGESYRCCCPFCGDRNFQLNVNHRYGTVDDRVGRLDFLATCFARGCIKNSDNRAALLARLTGGSDALAESRIEPGTRAPQPPDRLPDTFIRLAKLADEHPARLRLAGRGFDPDRLTRLFNLGYCREDEDERLARDRVVAPVSYRGELVGWLAVRFTADGVTCLCAPGMRAGAAVYNLDRAREHPAAIVVPSPEWVWRLGRCAVAPLTTVATERFADIVRSVFRHKQVVLATPADRPEDAELAQRLSSALGPAFAAVRLPRSAAGEDRKELLRLIRRAASDRGLAVTFQSNAG
jgi:hypothetical protein